MIPTVSVVIPTFNRGRLVVDAVRALMRQRDAPVFEVIVVVDGSTDGTAASLRSLPTSMPLHVLEQANKGLAAARNAGAFVAAGEILLFLDDDMEADELLVEAHARAHAAGAEVVVGSMPAHPDSTSTLVAIGVNSWARAWVRDLSTRRRLRWFDVLGGNLSIRRSLFDHLDGFCVEYNSGGRFGNEDLDLGFRVFAAGYRVAFAADAVARQRYQKSTRRYLEDHEDMGRADVRLACTWPATARYVFTEHWAGSEVHRAARAIVAVAPRLARHAVTLGEWMISGLVDGGRRSIMLRYALYFLAALRYHLGVRAAGGRPSARRVVALAFHSIANHGDHPSFAPYAIAPPSFTKIVDGLIRSGYAFVAVDEFTRWFRGEQALPRRVLLVTFDDAYEDIVSAAAVLGRRSIPSVVFVPTAFIGGHNSWEPPGAAPRKRLASESGLRELARAGVELASHGSHHVDLTTLSEEQLQLEIDEASECLARIRGTPPRMFAYPYGRHDRRAHAALAVQGIEAAFTVDPGPIEACDRPMTLRRLELSGRDTGVTLLWKLRVLRSAAWRVYPGLLKCRTDARRVARGLARRRRLGVTAPKGTHRRGSGLGGTLRRTTNVPAPSQTSD